MRRSILVLLALMLAALSVRAQMAPPGQAAPPFRPAAPAAPAAPTAQDLLLDRYLIRWEQEMQKVQTLVANLGRIEKDTTLNDTQKFVGFAQYMKVGTGTNIQNLALLEMKVEGRAEVAERFICTGTFLYQYVPLQKEIRAFELPKPKPGQVADDNFLSFLFGMKAEEARRRYDLKLANEDPHYVYIDIQPRRPADMADFKRARIVLNKDSFLPRQLWFESANGSEVTWDIPAIKSGLQVNRAIFDAPKPPQGWKLVPVARNAEAPPRTIRSGPTGP